MYNVSTITINTFNTTAINDSINYKVAAIRTMAITNFKKVFKRSVNWVASSVMGSKERAEVTMFVVASVFSALAMMATVPVVGVVPALVISFLASHMMAELTAKVSIVAVAVVVSTALATVAALAAIVIGVAHFV